MWNSGKGEEIAIKLINKANFPQIFMLMGGSLGREIEEMEKSKICWDCMKNRTKNNYLKRTFCKASAECIFNDYSPCLKANREQSVAGCSDRPLCS